MGRTEAAASGVSWTFARWPTCARRRWGRIVEGAGEDTYLATVLTAARVEASGPRARHDDQAFRRLWRLGGRARL